MPAEKVFQLLVKEVSTSVKHFTSGASTLANTLHLTLSTYFQFAILSWEYTREKTILKETTGLGWIGTSLSF